MRALQTASTGHRVLSGWRPSAALRLPAASRSPPRRRPHHPVGQRRDYASTMRAVRCLLFAAVFARCSVTGLREGWQPPTKDLVQPKRLLQQIHSQGELLHSHLDTRVQNPSGAAQPVHLARSSFRVEAFGNSFILDLELNHHLLSTDYVERHFEEDGQPSQIKGGEHCYYHGRVRGLPRSWVAVSTCRGLWGMFSDGNVSYAIEPAATGEADHVVYRVPLADFLLFPPPASGVNGGRTGAGGGDAKRRDRDERPAPGAKEKLANGGGRAKRQARQGQRTVQTETKYIELMVVNDHQLFVQQRRSTSQTKNFAKAVVNMADAIYKDQLNTRIVLVAMETWSIENRISVGDDALLTLRDFMKYRRASVRERCDAAHLLSGRTFMSSRSEAAYIGGVCSLSRGGGINEFGAVGPMAITLCQSLGQNIGMLRSKDRPAAGDCRCPDPWLGCIMEDTGYYLPRKFSRCSVDEYLRFLQQGGGSCLFNKPSKLLDPPECGNGHVELGEECDCGTLVECARDGANCCKKCTLTHNAMCSNGLCCRDCKYELRGVTCRQAVNDCDIPETCVGDSSQCPHNVHKLDGYTCEAGQGRCYGGRCKTRDSQCRSLWGYDAADRFCYEKLNSEGTEKGNCGPAPGGHGWMHCNKQDVLCGLLLCTNVTEKPSMGELRGKLTGLTVHHHNRYLDCRGGHAVLDDGSDLGYVEDGTPCGPNMMCLERRCLPVAAFNVSACPGWSASRSCSHHGTCSNEVKCICDRDYTGKDCSVFDPVPIPTPNEGPEKHQGPSGTNIIIGSVAGAILLVAIVLGGTGWGFKNIRRGRTFGGPVLPFRTAAGALFSFSFLLSSDDVIGPGCCRCPVLRTCRAETSSASPALRCNKQICGISGGFVAFLWSIGEMLPVITSGNPERIGDVFFPFMSRVTHVFNLFWFRKKNIFKVKVF
ncbi:disintegrin and metalloproteinase domain-containing protein 11-like isoform X2 [Hippocampus zosterae]|uniref:disintegrin and metalloproteinase domain-containing protein 11-like isoform X2 n=1 Tax=Hippocampus zosterae TaxID=109293 RepID=UPI00223E0674|nr:disintegrin and metalloproteinase domain-containing protein 11-like isoform X2 [Hippocampus zosterae]